MTTVTLTLNAIRKHRPCETGWTKLLRHLGKSKADNVEFPLLTVLESNGIEDTIWCFCALGEEHRKFIVGFACDCAERALKHVPAGEDRPKRAIEVTRAWIRGEATLDEVRAAGEAAYDAAAYAARAAYEAAAYDAAYAARAARAAAAYEAAAYAARGAERAAVRAAEREWQAARLRELLEAAS